MKFWSSYYEDVFYIFNLKATEIYNFEVAIMKIYFIFFNLKATEINNF